MTAKRLPSILLLTALALASPDVRAGDELTEDQAMSYWSYYNNMGWMAFNRGELDIAEFRFSKAIESIRPYQKLHLTITARSYHDLSRVLCAQKRFAEAEPLAKWVVEARDHDPKSRQDARFDSVYLVAVIERELHKDAESVPYFAKAVEIEEKNLGSASPQLALTIKEMADAEVRAGDLARADTHYLRAIRIHEHGNPNTPDLAAALEARASVLDRLNRGPEARASEARADEVRGKTTRQARRSAH
jgi:tetratricopeptide (TPR) repeat protein